MMFFVGGNPTTWYIIFCKYRLLIFSCFWWLLLWPIGGYTQQVRLQVQTFPNEGLGNLNLKGACTDDRGFVWLATNYGLNRFDGLALTHYTEESHGLYSNYMRRVICGPDNHLWLSYGDPINQLYYVEIFDPLTETIISLDDYLQDSLPSPLAKNTLTISPNTDRSLWLFDKNYLYEYQDRQLKKLVALPIGYRISNAFKTNDHFAWITASQNQNEATALFYADNQGHIVDSMLINAKISNIVRSNQDESVYFTLSKNERSTIYRKVPGAAFRQLDIPSTQHHVICRYSQQTSQFWCMSEEAHEQLEIFSVKADEIVRIFSGQIPIAPATKVQIQMAMDDAGRLWISQDQQLILLQLAQDPFQQYLHTPTYTSNLANSPYSIRGITKDGNGNLYITTDARFSFVQLKGEQGFRNLDSLIGTDHNLQPSMAVFADKDGSVWLSRKGHQLIHYLPDQHIYRLYDFDSLSHQQLNGVMYQWVIYRDRKGRLWIGHSDGLAYLDEAEGVIHHFETEADLKVVFHLYENDQGMWLCTATGLYLMNDQYKVIARYHSKGDPTHYLPHNNIAHLLEEEDGKMWLASKGGGLIHWDPATGEYEQFTTATGLAHNIIYAVYEDDQHHLWLSSNEGLMRFDKLTHEVVHFMPENGITDQEFNTIAHYKDADGKLYFGSLNGLTVFDPADIAADASNTPLAILSVEAYDNQQKQYINHTLNTLQENQITIPPSTRDVKLRFVSLDFKAPHQIQYAYKIEGLDNDWQMLKDPEIHLAGLPYGHHRLLLNAKGIGSTWAKEPRSIELIALRPFYFTWWFALCVIIGLVGMILLIFRLRLRFLQQQQAKLKQEVYEKTAQVREQAAQLKSFANQLEAINEMKSRFYVNISHELRTPLTLILGPLSHLLDQPPNDRNDADLQNQLQLMERNGKRLLFLIEEILDLSKLESDQMVLQIDTVDLSYFCYWIYSMFASQAAQQKIDYQYDYQAADKCYLKIDANKTEKVLINLIGNAIKFTPSGGRVVFSIAEEKEQLTFKVSDTGIGIPIEDQPHIFDRFYQTDAKSGIGTGVGLDLSKEIANLMNGELYVQSQPGEGSTFIFAIPKQVVAPEQYNAHQGNSFAIEETSSTDPEEEDGDDASAHAVEKDKPHLLVVEDNPDMQTFLASLLVGHYQVQQVGNGQEAKQLLEDKDHSIDLILSDVMMPVMDGLAFSQWLKSSEHHNQIPLILLTAQGSHQSKLEALDIGVDDYLTKPFSSSELLARIRNLITNAQLRKFALYEEPDDLINEVFSEKQRAWLKEVEQTTRELAVDQEFDADALAKAVFLSLRSLQRKLKQATGLTVRDYIKEIRLQVARELLESGEYDTIAQVAFQAGFGTPYYFSKLYEKRFGKKVSDFFINYQDN